jgi:drug/metabolite transporter (DMT)-like permease
VTSARGGGPSGTTVVCTASALVAFAANSVLCRLALGRGAIDAASFSTLRLASGSLALLALSAGLRNGRFRVGGNWRSASLLFLYAVPFSFAYVTLSAGTGALILFGSVQATMLMAAFGTGERPHPLHGVGLGLALIGLVVLVLPGLRSPPSPVGAVLMAVGGISWGFYSLRGRGPAGPLAETTGNFIRALPLALVVSLLSARHLHVAAEGAALAVMSGAVASGVGYVFWYAALKGLSATRAATVQLPVPVLAAAGGVIVLSEKVSLRLVAAAILILGGVALALSGRDRRRGPRSG